MGSYWGRWPINKPNDTLDSVVRKIFIRREAIKRNPHYRQEFEAAFQFFREHLTKAKAAPPEETLIEFQSSPEGRKLAHKWGLIQPVHPDREVCFLKEGQPAPMPDGEKYIPKLWQCAPLLLADKGKAIEIIGLPDDSLGDKIVTILRHLNFPAYYLTEGRYLMVKVDMLAPKNQVLGEIKYLWDECQKGIVAMEIERRWLNQVRQFQEQGKPLPPLMEQLAELREQVEKDLHHKRRGQAVDIRLTEEPSGGHVTIFQVWDMNKKEGKSPWKIAQELNPDLKTLTAKGCTRKKCPDKLDFQTLTKKKKENYSNKFCGKKDSCLIAKALLKKVRDAIDKADSLIASVFPIE